MHILLSEIISCFAIHPVVKYTMPVTLVTKSFLLHGNFSILPIIIIIEMVIREKNDATFSATLTQSCKYRLFILCSIHRSFCHLALYAALRLKDIPSG